MPPRGGSVPVSRRMSVDFPAPFGPARAAIMDDCNCRDMSFRTSRESYPAFTLSSSATASCLRVGFNIRRLCPQDLFECRYFGRLLDALPPYRDSYHVSLDS